MVPLDVIVPPLNPVPAVIDVTVPGLDEPFAAAVIWPCALTVILAFVYDPAVTAVLAIAIVVAPVGVYDDPESPVLMVNALNE